MDGLHIRALEAYAACTLTVGGTELPAAVRAGRELTRRELGIAPSAPTQELHKLLLA